jgi:hypothetical protein
MVFGHLFVPMVNQWFGRTVIYLINCSRRSATHHRNETRCGFLLKIPHHLSSSSAEIVAATLKMDEIAKIF